MYVINVKRESWGASRSPETLRRSADCRPYHGDTRDFWIKCACYFIDNFFLVCYRFGVLFDNRLRKSRLAHPIAGTPRLCGRGSDAGPNPGNFKLFS